MPEIDAGDSVTVRVALTVAADAAGGTAMISTTDSSVELDLPVEGNLPPADTVPTTEQPAVRKDDATIDQPIETTGTTATTGP